MALPDDRPMPTSDELSRYFDTDLLALFEAVKHEAFERGLCTKCGSRLRSPRSSYCPCERDE